MASKEIKAFRSVREWKNELRDSYGLGTVRLDKAKLGFKKLFAVLIHLRYFFTKILTKWFLWLFDKVIFDVLAIDIYGSSPPSKV